MNFDQIATFLAIYQSGSYKKAAEQLYLPQPTVSNRIKQLEEDLGYPLFIRDKRGVSLTEEGRTYLPYAKKIVSSYYEGKEAVGRLKHGLQGKLSIASNNSFTASIMPGVLESFISRYPNVDIQLLSYTTLEQVRRIKDKEFQLGITRYTINDPQLSFQQLYEEEVKLIVSPEHPFRHRSAVDIREILKQRLILYHSDTLYRRTIDMALSNHNLQYDLKYETNNLHLIKYMVRRNLGVFISGPLFFQDELNQGQVFAVRMTGNPFPVSRIFLMFRDGELNSLDQLFISHYTDYMKRLSRSAGLRSD